MTQMSKTKSHSKNTYICLSGAKDWSRLKDSQLIFTCSKSTIETLEKGVKYGQSQQ